jgi:RNA polymerase sigma-70 factor (ECF subfamily)
VERNEVSNRLYQLVEELPDKYRSVLILADLYELDYCEIAEILNVPLGTVKSRLARARQRMRGKILNNFENFGLDFPVVGMLYG